MALKAEDLFTRFPAMPSLTAQWAPLYLEPLPGSGERLTVAVAAIAADGQHHIARVLDIKRARCMYGPQAEFILGLVDLLHESLHAHLESGAALADWISPLQGTATLGPASIAHGDSVQEITQSGLMLSASLSVAPAHNEGEVDTAGSADPAVDEWVRQIREETVRLRENFRPRFGCNVPLSPGAPPTRVGYYGDRLAAQFGRLIPGRRLTQLHNRAKAFITDLQILRDTDRSSRQASLLTRDHYELLLWTPPERSPEYTEQQHADARGALDQLIHFADQHEMRVEAMGDVQTAVRRILRQEEPRPYRAH